MPGTIRYGCVCILPNGNLITDDNHGSLIVINPENKRVVEVLSDPIRKSDKKGYQEIACIKPVSYEDQDAILVVRESGVYEIYDSTTCSLIRSVSEHIKKNKINNSSIHLTTYKDQIFLKYGESGSILIPTMQPLGILMVSKFSKDLHSRKLKPSSLFVCPDPGKFNEILSFDVSASFMVVSRNKMRVDVFVIPTDTERVITKSVPISLSEKVKRVVVGNIVFVRMISDDDVMLIDSKGHIIVMHISASIQRRPSTAGGVASPSKPIGGVSVDVKTVVTLNGITSGMNGMTFKDAEIGSRASAKRSRTPSLSSDKDKKDTAGMFNVGKLGPKVASESRYTSVIHTDTGASWMIQIDTELYTVKQTMLTRPCSRKSSSKTGESDGGLMSSTSPVRKYISHSLVSKEGQMYIISTKNTRELTEEQLDYQESSPFISIHQPTEVPGGNNTGNAQNPVEGIVKVKVVKKAKNGKRIKRGDNKNSKSGGGNNNIQIVQLFSQQNPFNLPTSKLVSTRSVSYPNCLGDYTNGDTSVLISTQFVLFINIKGTKYSLSDFSPIAGQLLMTTMREQPVVLLEVKPGCVILVEGGAGGGGVSPSDASTDLGNSSLLQAKKSLTFQSKVLFMSHITRAKDRIAIGTSSGVFIMSVNDLDTYFHSDQSSPIQVQILQVLMLPNEHPVSVMQLDNNKAIVIATTKRIIMAEPQTLAIVTSSFISTIPFLLGGTSADGGAATSARDNGRDSANCFLQMYQASPNCAVLVSPTHHYWVTDTGSMRCFGNRCQGGLYSNPMLDDDRANNTASNTTPRGGRGSDTTATISGIVSGFVLDRRFALFGVDPITATPPQTTMGVETASLYGIAKVTKEYLLALPTIRARALVLLFAAEGVDGASENCVEIDVKSIYPIIATIEHIYPVAALFLYNRHQHYKRVNEIVKDEKARAVIPTPIISLLQRQKAQLRQTTKYPPTTSVVAKDLDAFKLRCAMLKSSNIDSLLTTFTHALKNITSDSSTADIVAKQLSKLEALQRYNDMLQKSSSLKAINIPTAIDHYITPEIRYALGVEDGGAWGGFGGEGRDLVETKMFWLYALWEVLGFSRFYYNENSLYDGDASTSVGTGAGTIRTAGASSKEYMSDRDREREKPDAGALAPTDGTPSRKARSQSGTVTKVDDTAGTANMSNPTDTTKMANTDNNMSQSDSDSSFGFSAGSSMNSDDWGERRKTNFRIKMKAKTLESDSTPITNTNTITSQTSSPAPPRPATTAATTLSNPNTSLPGDRYAWIDSLSEGSDWLAEDNRLRQIQQQQQQPQAPKQADQETLRGLYANIVHKALDDPSAAGSEITDIFKSFDIPVDGKYCRNSFRQLWLFCAILSKAYDMDKKRAAIGTGEGAQGGSGAFIKASARMAAFLYCLTKVQMTPPILQQRAILLTALAFLDCGNVSASNTMLKIVGTSQIGSLGKPEDEERLVKVIHMANDYSVDKKQLPIGPFTVDLILPVIRCWQCGEMTMDSKAGRCSGCEAIFLFSCTELKPIDQQVSQHVTCGKCGATCVTPAPSQCPICNAVMG